MNLSNWTKNKTYFLTGRNGSGKTTLLKKLYLHPSFEKEIKVFIDQMPLDLYPHCYLKKILNFLKNEKNFHLNSFLKDLKNLQLEKILDQQFFSLSAGEKQLFKILLFLSFDFNILFIDEPFNYLDSYHENFILNKIKKFQKDKTIFITDPQEKKINYDTKILLPEEQNELCFI